MAVDDVALALIAMSDSSVRESVRRDDFSPLGSRQLSDHERQLVRLAADDPEVDMVTMVTELRGPAGEYLLANQRQLSPDVRRRFLAFAPNARIAVASSWL